MDKKVIMLFLDLEGTIIGEENGNISEERIDVLLNSINNLEKATNKKVNIHIVSPVSIKSMEIIIDDIDNASSSPSNEEVINVEKKVSEVKYDPIEPEKETIEIVDDVEPSKNKSGLLLVIVLFVLLGLFIVFLPKK